MTLWIRVRLGTLSVSHFGAGLSNLQFRVSSASGLLVYSEGYVFDSNWPANLYQVAYECFSFTPVPQADLKNLISSHHLDPRGCLANRHRHSLTRPSPQIFTIQTIQLTLGAYQSAFWQVSVTLWPTKLWDGSVLRSDRTLASHWCWSVESIGSTWHHLRYHGIVYDIIPCSMI